MSVEQHYWDSAEHSIRDEIMAVIALCEPFGSLLEVGAHVGPNLKRIGERWPGVTLYAIEHYASLLQYGKERLPAVIWTEAEALGDLPKWADASVDVILDVGCLESGNNLPCGQQEMRRHYARVAARGIVHLAPLALTEETITHYGTLGWSCTANTLAQSEAHSGYRLTAFAPVTPAYGCAHITSDEAGKAPSE